MSEAWELDEIELDDGEITAVIYEGERYTRERTCNPHGEWERITQTQEVRFMYCDCGYELGMDEHDTFTRTRLFDRPNYCPACGRRIADE